MKVTGRALILSDIIGKSRSDIDTTTKKANAEKTTTEKTKTVQTATTATATTTTTTTNFAAHKKEPELASKTNKKRDSLSRNPKTLAKSDFRLICKNVDVEKTFPKCKQSELEKVFGRPARMCVPLENSKNAKESTPRNFFPAIKKDGTMVYVYKIDSKNGDKKKKSDGAFYKMIDYAPLRMFFTGKYKMFPAKTPPNDNSFVYHDRDKGEVGFVYWTSFFSEKREEDVQNRKSKTKATLMVDRDKNENDHGDGSGDENKKKINNAKSNKKRKREKPITINGITQAGKVIVEPDDMEQRPNKRFKSDSEEKNFTEKYPSSISSSSDSEEETRTKKNEKEEKEKEEIKTLKEWASVWNKGNLEAIVKKLDRAENRSFAFRWSLVKGIYEKKELERALNDFIESTPKSLTIKTRETVETFLIMALIGDNAKDGQKK